MARARNIKPSFFTSEALADQSPLGRLLFIGLWTIADFKGDLEWKARTIKVQLLPFDECDIKQLAINLDKSGLVRFYSVDGKIYLSIPNFNKHQNPHKNEREGGSEVPAFNDTARQLVDLTTLTIIPEKTRVVPDQNGIDPADSPIPITDSLLLTPDPLFLKPDVLIPETLHTQPTVAAQVEEVFKYWVYVMAKTPQALLTPKRDHAVRAMLKLGYSVEAIKKAIDGCRRSPHHMGVNANRTVYDDLELICRTGEKLEGFMTNTGTASGVETIAMTQERIQQQAERVSATLDEYLS